MAREWYQPCKDCQTEFGYSDTSYESDQLRGHSRPERCPTHRRQHALEIQTIASSHFGLVPRAGASNILGQPFLGAIQHGSRALRAKERAADPSRMDIGITNDNVRELYAALETNKVVVVVGPTGSGKSTYIPYRLVDPLSPYAKTHFTQYGPIIITQPRIQATRALPDTVASLLLGASVGPGFEVGFRHGDAHAGRKGDQYDLRNRLVYVTDGTLLNWIADGKIGNFSIVIIDEAHERSCNIDVILGLLKRELAKYSHLRLIVASATIDAEHFVDYYAEGLPTALLQFEGKRNHGYERHFWEGPPIKDEEMPRKVAEQVVKILKGTKDGGILAFLPGQNEINTAVRLVQEQMAGVLMFACFLFIRPLALNMGLRP